MHTKTFKTLGHFEPANPSNGVSIAHVKWSHQAVLEQTSSSIGVATAVTWQSPLQQPCPGPAGGMAKNDNGRRPVLSVAARASGELRPGTRRNGGRQPAAAVAVRRSIRDDGDVSKW